MALLVACGGSALLHIFVTSSAAIRVSESLQLLVIGKKDRTYSKKRCVSEFASRQQLRLRTIYQVDNENCSMSLAYLRAESPDLGLIREIA